MLRPSHKLTTPPHPKSTTRTTQHSPWNFYLTHRLSFLHGVAMTSTPTSRSWFFFSQAEEDDEGTFWQLGWGGSWNGNGNGNGRRGGVGAGDSRRIESGKLNRKSCSDLSELMVEDVDGVQRVYMTCIAFPPDLLLDKDIDLLHTNGYCLNNPEGKYLIFHLSSIPNQGWIEPRRYPPNMKSKHP